MHARKDLHVDKQTDWELEIVPGRDVSSSDGEVNSSRLTDLAIVTRRHFFSTPCADSKFFRSMPTKSTHTT